jgi:hypothetical protein
MGSPVFVKVIFIIYSWGELGRFRENRDILLKNIQKW